MIDLSENISLITRSIRKLLVTIMEYIVTRKYNYNYYNHIVDVLIPT